MKRRIATTLSALALFSAASHLIAGPLTPPTGPVTSTMKTMTEVEPRIAINATNTPGDATSLFKITQPGSYYLTGNVTGVAAKSGIVISAANVTLDLNGFTVAGIPGSLTGISTNSPAFTLKNGTVTGWGGAGVSVGSNARVSDITTRVNGSVGLSVVGVGAVVESCIAASNGDDGIRVGDNGIIRNSVANLNTSVGIRVGSSSRVESSVATANGGVGISLNNNGVAVGCTADDNVLSGFTASDQSSIHDCSASGNGVDGIEVSFGVHVARCTLYVNANNGISCGAACRIEDNNCRLNGTGAPIGAGILAQANSNRTIVKNNTVFNSDFGIKVEGANNLILGNSVGVNTTNFEIVAGNRVGIILSVPTSGAISGNTGGTAITNTDANYVY